MVSAGETLEWESTAVAPPSAPQKRCGLTMAVGYGLVRAPRARGFYVLGGAMFGVGLWALGDELAVPLLGLGEKPTEHPPSMHITTLAAHVGYGVATAATTRALDMFMS